MLEAWVEGGESGPVIVPAREQADTPRQPEIGAVREAVREHEPSRTLRTRGEYGAD